MTADGTGEENRNEYIRNPRQKWRDVLNFISECRIFGLQIDKKKNINCIPGRGGAFSSICIQALSCKPRSNYSLSTSSRDANKPIRVRTGELCSSRLSFRTALMEHVIVIKNYNQQTQIHTNAYTGAEL